MGVRRRLLRELLSSLKYIKNLTEQQIKASLWRGETTLYNLELEPQKLQQFFHDVWPCGLEIVKATVKEVSIRIPWSQIMTQSILVIAQDIEVEVVAHCEDDTDWQEVVVRMQQQYIRNQQAKLQNARFGTLSSGATGAFDQLRQRLVDGVQIQVNRAKLSIHSRHARHVPSHEGEAEAGAQEDAESPVGEVLTVIGEDIIISPADASHRPCHKLKGVATFCAESYLMQLNKFMKCRAFHVAPGGFPNKCRHASPEYMASPVVLTGRISTRYPSDGASTCPFVQRSELSFECNSGLRVRGCECQLRAFLALAMDVGRLEEWRGDERLLFASASASCSAAADAGAAEGLVNTSSMARTFAKGQALPSASQRPARAEGSSAWLPTGRAAAAAAEAALAPAAGAAAAEAAGAAEAGAADAAPSEFDDQVSIGKVTSIEAFSAASSTAGFDSPSSAPTAEFPSSQQGEEQEAGGRPATTLDVAAVPSGGPSSLSFEHEHLQSRCLVGFGSAGPLQDTSALARTFAQGPEVRRPPPPVAGAFDPLVVRACAGAGTGIWKILKQAKPASLLGAASMTSSPVTQPSLPTGELDQRPWAPELPAALVQVRLTSSPDDASPSAGQTPRTGGLDTTAAADEQLAVVEASALGQAAEAEVGAALNVDRPAGLDGGQEVKKVDRPASLDQEEDDDEIQGFLDDSEEEDFYDPDDYFSVGSVASGDAAADVADSSGGAAGAQARWLKPVLAWLGSNRSLPSVSKELPEVGETSKCMSVTLSQATFELTAIDLTRSEDEQAPVRIQWCMDGCVWTSEAGLSLTDAQQDCLFRLRRSVEDTAHLSAAEFGFHSVPRVLRGLQRMRWPVFTLSIQGPTGDAQQLFARLQDGHTASGSGSPALVSFVWQPRSAPPVLMESSGWVSHTWPLHICMSHAEICADTTAWAAISGCQTRCKPHLSSKFPLSTMVAPRAAPQGADGRRFPTESMSVELVQCEVIEPQTTQHLEESRRWPYRVSVPYLLLRSRSELWDFEKTLARWGSAFSADGHDPAASVLGAPGRHVPLGAVSAPPPGVAGDGDVTLPKETFDFLVRRAADATLKESQYQAAREELQKAYISLAGSRGGGGSSSAAAVASSAAAAASAAASAAAAALPSLAASAAAAVGLGGGGAGSAASSAGALAGGGVSVVGPATAGSATEVGGSARAPAVESQAVGELGEVGELERMRRRCVQLESLLQSQGLAQRRLETELTNYQALAREELRQLMCPRPMPARGCNLGYRPPA